MLDNEFPGSQGHGSTSPCEAVLWRRVMHQRISAGLAMFLPALLWLSVPGPAPAPSSLWTAKVIRQVGGGAKALSQSDRIAVSLGGLKPGLTEQVARDDTEHDRQHNHHQIALCSQQSQSPDTVSPVDRMCLAKEGWAAKTQPARRRSRRAAGPGLAAWLAPGGDTRVTASWQRVWGSVRPSGSGRQRQFVAFGCSR